MDKKPNCHAPHLIKIWSLGHGPRAIDTTQSTGPRAPTRGSHVSQRRFWVAAAHRYRPARLRVDSGAWRGGERSFYLPGCGNGYELCCNWSKCVNIKKKSRNWKELLVSWHNRIRGTALPRRTKPLQRTKPLSRTKPQRSGTSEPNWPIQRRLLGDLIWCALRLTKHQLTSSTLQK